MSSNDNGGTLEPKLNLDGIEDAVILRTKAQEERDARVKEADARKQLTARATTAEQAFADYKKAHPEIEPVITKKDDPKPYSILDDEAASMILEGYKPDEVRFVLANGGRKVLEDKESFVTIAVNTKRDQRNAEIAASGAEGTGKSDVFKQYTAEQLKNMKSADLEKILPKTY